MGQWGGEKRKEKVVSVYGYARGSAGKSLKVQVKALSEAVKEENIVTDAAGTNAFCALWGQLQPGDLLVMPSLEVLGGRNADAAAGVVAGSGAWSYADEVAYPFGYGLSYTEFGYSDYTVEKVGSDYHVSMTITNVGDRAGKEVMQVYLQKPYTDYDREHGIEKAAVELVGFAKTKELAPGESQELTVTVPEYEFKCYDAYGERTYILEKGDYYLTAGADAHEAVNNILAAKGYTVADGMTAEGDAELVSRHSYLWDDRSTYAVSLAGAEVTNRFDDADVNLYEGTRGQEIVYLSRSDWKATWPSSPVSLSASDEIVAALAYEQPVPENADDVMPAYGKESAEYGHLNLIQLKEVPYEDPLWDDLLDQLTFEEQISLLKTKEWVLSEQMVDNLTTQMDRINLLSEALSDLPDYAGNSTFADVMKQVAGSKTVNNVTNNSKPIELQIGDTTIYGADQSTVKEHIKITRDMVNQIGRIIGIGR